MYDIISFPGQLITNSLTLFTRKVLNFTLLNMLRMLTNHLWQELSHTMLQFVSAIALSLCNHGDRLVFLYVWMGKHGLVY